MSGGAISEPGDVQPWVRKSSAIRVASLSAASWEIDH